MRPRLPAPLVLPPMLALCSDGCDISVTAGSFPTEISWSMSCSDGTTLSEGAPPFSGSVSVADGSTCTVSLVDSFGDGWNGAVWTGFEESLQIMSGKTFDQTFFMGLALPPPPGPPPSPGLPPCAPPPPPSPPLPLMPPLSPGWSVVGTAAELKSAVEALSPGTAATFVLPAGGHFYLSSLMETQYKGDGFLTLNGVDVTLVCRGSGTVLDAQQAGRMFSLTSGSSVKCINLNLMGSSATVCPAAASWCLCACLEIF